MRQSYQAALETIELKEEERASAHAKLDARIAETTKQLVAARAETEALQPIVLALRTRAKELEAADQGSSDAATMAKLEKRYRQDLSAKDKLIASLIPTDRRCQQACQASEDQDPGETQTAECEGVGEGQGKSCGSRLGRGRRADRRR